MKKREIFAYSYLTLVTIGLLLFTSTSLDDNIVKPAAEKNKFIDCIVYDKCGKPLYKTVTYHSIFWVFTHFILYLILGICIPNKWGFIISSIVIWEIAERFLVTWSSLFSENWKSAADVIADIIGYALGMYLIK